MSAVLIVDDDTDLRAAVSDGLAEEGWTVVEADSVNRALELARTHHVDVVLSDLRLADGDGRTLQHAFAAERPPRGLPVVFMTGLSLRDRDTDPTTVLTKPFDVVEATAALEQAVLLHRRGGDRAAPKDL